METVVRNQVFSRLWNQAGSTALDRPTDRAQNGQGRRAIKFKTDGFYKVLIVEVNRRPGFEVRVFGLPDQPGLVNSDGLVTFANPMETAELQGLIHQIDRWTTSFETVFGQRVADRPWNVASTDSSEDLAANERMGSTDQDQISSEENEGIAVPSCQSNRDEWDQEGVAATSDRA